MRNRETSALLFFEGFLFCCGLLSAVLDLFAPSGSASLPLGSISVLQALACGAGLLTLLRRHSPLLTVVLLATAHFFYELHKGYAQPDWTFGGFLALELAFILWVTQKIWRNHVAGGR
ncbi:hypothetical protein [Deinococcus sp.]|uniref:hypothetical protein n=1 Tax=Deinococcus sp. TaxID=47478 RepID=UPI003CC54643